MRDKLNKSSRRWSWLLAISALLLHSPANTAEPLPWVKNALKIEHPGKITVEYLGPLKESPLRNRLKVGDKYFTLFEDVIGPDYHTAQLIEWAEVHSNEDVLEIGAGIGAVSIFLAPNAKRILATDISANAIANSRFNIEQFGLTDKIRLRQGDLFKAVEPGEQFDVIFFNVIYPFNAKTLHHWTLHERFFREVGSFLKPNGRIYYQAGYIENIPKVHQMVMTNNLRITAMHMMHVPKYGREPIVFVIERKVPPQ